MENNNLWEKIGNACLERAQALLESETVSTAATAETVKTLVDVAISIDLLNLRRKEQSRYGARVFPGQPFSQQAEGN